jgi:flagellar motor switch protein FliN/FliY
MPDESPEPEGAPSPGEAHEMLAKNAGAGAGGEASEGAGESEASLAEEVERMAGQAPDKPGLAGGPEARRNGASAELADLAGPGGLEGAGHGDAPAVSGAGGVDLPDFAEAGEAGPINVANMELLKDVDLTVKIELGRCRMLVEDVLRLGEGSVVELDKLAGDPVDVFVNERLVARGEVLVLNDNFCVRINEIVCSVEQGE